MNPLNKHEAAGIFLSVAVMAVALAFLRFNTDVFATALNSTSDSQVASVIAVREMSSDERVLESTLIDAHDAKGNLVRLVIDDIRLGTGKAVEEGDTVVAHYIGSTQDGVRFDSSYERGEPFIFTVGGGKVIEGWEKGLLGMKVGGQRVLVIPSEMAYGNMQVGVIPPNSPLVFAIELLEVR